MSVVNVLYCLSGLFNFFLKERDFRQGQKLKESYITYTNS